VVVPNRKSGTSEIGNHRGAWRRLASGSALAAGLIGAAPVARAAPPVTWQGSTPDWFTGSNWSGGAVPTSTDTVVINATATAPTVVANTASFDSLTIGQTGGSATLSVEGGGVLTSSDPGGTVVIGDAGIGSLRVVGTSILSTAGTITIGNSAGGTGALTVQDASDVQTTSNVIVGAGGNGSLNISESSELQTTNAANLTVARDSGSTGTVSVDGTNSTLAVAGLLTVGEAGQGTLTVTNSGQVTVKNFFFGDAATGTASVTIDGASFSDSGSGANAVGEHGTATLTIRNGGTLSTYQTYIGDGVNSSGTVTVDGAHSTWNNTTSLTVGSFGTGALNITNGGSVTTSTLYLGANGSASGSVSVDGPGSTLSASIEVGEAGRGTLSITNGAQVNSAIGIVGYAGQGTATVDGAGSLWTGLTAGQLVMGYMAGGNGTLTLSNGGQVDADVVTLAVNAGSTGTLNIGAAPGSAAVAPGTLNATSVQFGSGTGAINFNHTSSNYSFDAAISGAGAINQIAGTTDLTANSSGFTGTTTVSGGTLIVNGTLGGTLNVLAGGRLGGSGQVGTTTVSGTIAPGSSPGILNVAGNITFNPGSTYLVNVFASGQSDAISATGTATINGGTVNVVAGTGNYAPSTTYRILFASGGRSGTFDGVTSNLAFLTPSLSYDANYVYLTMGRNGVSFQNVGSTPNQIATGSGVESLGAGSAVYKAVLNLSAPQAQYAFNQLSGEVHASIKTTLIEDSHFVRNAVSDRLRAAFGSACATTCEATSPVDGKPVTAPGTADGTVPGLAIWSLGFGSWGQTAGDGNAARINRSTGGFFIGADAPAGDAWRLGAMAGYSRTSFDVSDRSSSGSSDNYHVGLYGGATWGDLAVRTGAAYTWHNIATSRSVVFPGFSDSDKGYYSAGSAQVFGEVAYGVTAGTGRFEPFANVAYVDLHTNGFTEQGGAAALTTASAFTDATFTTFGLRTGKVFDLNGASLTAKGMLGWRHDFGEATPTSTMQFAGGGASFTVDGAPVARDAAVVEAGLDYALTANAVLGIAYNGQYGSGLADQSFRANFTWKF